MNLNEDLMERLVMSVVGHQRIPTFKAEGQNRCGGCDHLEGESDGPNSPRVVRHQIEVLLSALSEEGLLALETCGASLGNTKPYWMGVDQWDGPCTCVLLKGHDGDHRCSHTTEGPT